MVQKNMKYPDTAMYNLVLKQLNSKGVELEDIAKIVVDVQKRFLPDLTEDEALKALISILHKREVMNIVSVALYLDEAAEKGSMPEPINTIIKNDLGVFNVDEYFAINIAGVFGSIGVTNFGKLDVDKTGIIKKLDTTDKVVNTFIDDIVGGLAGATMAKVAHERS